jgi:hypothetical protein
MLMTKGRPKAIRTLRGWAIHALQEAGAIHECEEHGWAKDGADPHARERIGRHRVARVDAQVEDGVLQLRWTSFDNLKRGELVVVGDVDKPFANAMLNKVRQIIDTFE